MTEASKSAAHTPGPWFADKLQDRSAFNIFMPGYASAGASVHHCSSANGCMGGIEVEANARLIAAAPQMLQALQALVFHAEDFESLCMALGKARAAIAKATGSAA